MFGPSVGLCWGDFSCQYNHIRGRLYACTEAILFYSNLFGFEKKFCFRYDDVLQVQLYRSTSIQISFQEQPTSNNQIDSSTYDYIFKGFSDRIQTLGILIDLWEQSQGAENIESADKVEDGITDDNIMIPETSSHPSLDILSLSPTGGDDDMTVMSLDAQSQPNLPLLPPSILRSSKVTTPQHSNLASPARTMDPNTTPRRLFAAASGRRPKSLPPLHRRRNRERANSEGAQPSFLPGNSNVSDNASDTMELDQPPNGSDRAAWEATKKSADPCIQDVGIEVSLINI